MKESSFEQEVAKLANEIANLVVAKRKDYGTNNILNSIIEPELAIAVRLSDKLSRLVNLQQSGKEPQNESVRDTAADIVGYGLVLLMVLDGTFDTVLDEDRVPF